MNRCPWCSEPMKENLMLCDTCSQGLDKCVLSQKSIVEDKQMKPKCLACGEELTRKNRDWRWFNFCKLCVKNCTKNSLLELLSMENDSKRLDK